MEEKGEQEQAMWDCRPVVKYDGFWCPARIFPAVLSFQKNFKLARSSDIILSTMPKSGTTWLKALTFSIANRNLHTIDRSPLLTSNPHELVRFFEYDLYLHHENADLESIPSRRIFGTHIPFANLPHSIQESDCKIIYICRNPLDQFVSLRHFFIENNNVDINELVAPKSHEAFDLFCNGVHPFGPFWEHMLGYWKAHQENPRKVLFLKYEDLKEDVGFHVKKIAEFIGFPFSPDEEERGLIEQISTFCSFENLRNMEVNKNGYVKTVKNSSFFRKGEVGDWKNHLTAAMAERMGKIMESKLGGSGLMFEV